MLKKISLLIIFFTISISTKAENNQEIIQKITNKFDSINNIQFDFIQTNSELIEKGSCFLSYTKKLVCRYLGDEQKEIIINDSDVSHVNYVEEAYQKGILERKHLDNIVSTRLKNISSICFGGSDLKTVFLGCLLGDKIATFKSEIAGLQPTHWNPIKLINKSFP